MTSDTAVYERPDNQPEILRIRVDGVISAKTIYHKNERKIYVFIDNFENQNIHLSVVPGRNAGLYDDVSIISDLTSTVIIKMLQDISKSFTTDVDAEPTLTIDLPGNGANDGSLSVANLLNTEITFNPDIAPNAACGDNISLYKDEDGGSRHRTSTRNPGNIFGQKQTVYPNNGTQTTTRNMLTSNFGSRTELTDPNSIFTFDECERSTWIGDGENILEEVLCDLVLNDVYLTPTIIFDNDNGYIHVGADVSLDLKEEE